MRAEAATSSRTSRGYAIAVSGVVVWSWTGILVSYLLRSRPIAPMTLAFWRDLTAASSSSTASRSRS